MALKHSMLRSPTLATLAATLVVAVECAEAQQVLADLSSNRGLFGADDLFGNDVAWLGDVDGDNVDDFVIGAQEEDDNTPWGPNSFGAGYVMSGATGAVIRKHLGTNYGGRLGYQVAGGEDFDADGVNDYVVASPLLPWATKEGQVYVYSGATGNLIRSYSGERSGDYFGDVVAMLGDVDGDGVEDLGVGSPFRDWHNRPQVGRVYVYSGKTGSLVFHITGSKAYMYAGTICGLGDIDGDGRADLGVGSPGFGAGPNGEGIFEVYSSNGPTLLYSLKGAAVSNSFGAYASRVGLVDGDGIPDFAVAAIGYTSNSAEEGRVYVYSGANGKKLYQYDGLLRLEHFGRVPGVGGIDLNADGFDEILIGSMRGIAGVMGGGVWAYSGRTGGLLYEFRGAIDGGAEEGLGTALSAAGDFNSDGFDDFIVGASANSRNQFQEGRAYVIGGNDLFLQANADVYSAGSPVTLDIRGGNPGALAMFVVVDVSGAPMFLPLLIAPLDVNGNLQLAATVPTGLSGLTATFMGYAQKASGHGLADSIPETIAFN